MVCNIWLVAHNLPGLVLGIGCRLTCCQQRALMVLIKVLVGVLYFSLISLISFITLFISLSGITYVKEMARR